MSTDYSVNASPRRRRLTWDQYVMLALVAVAVIVDIVAAVTTVQFFRTAPQTVTVHTIVDVSTLAAYEWQGIQNPQIKLYCQVNNFPAESYFGGEPNKTRIERAEAMCLTADNYLANDDFAACSHWLVLATQETMPGNVTRKSTPILRVPRQICNAVEGLGTPDVDQPITSTSS